MSDRGFGFSPESSASWRTTRRWWDTVVPRGIMRSVIGTFAMCPMIVPLAIIYDQPHGEDRTICLAISAAGAALFLLTLRWFGKGRGILWGLWLWLVSYGFFSGILLAASAVRQFIAWKHGEPIDEDTEIVSAVIGVGLIALCATVLKRIDGDS